jgi:hypothetical protein
MRPGPTTITDPFRRAGGLLAIGEKNRLGDASSILGGRTRARASRECARGNRRATENQKDEADISAEEAKASPGARVPRPHALARRSANTQAPAQQGTQAPVRLTVLRAR